MAFRPVGVSFASLSVSLFPHVCWRGALLLCATNLVSHLISARALALPAHSRRTRHAARRWSLGYFASKAVLQFAYARKLARSGRSSGSAAVLWLRRRSAGPVWALCCGLWPVSLWPTHASFGRTPASRGLRFAPAARLHRRRGAYPVPQLRLKFARLLLPAVPRSFPFFSPAACFLSFLPVSEAFAPGSSQCGCLGRFFSLFGCATYAASLRIVFLAPPRGLFWN